MQINLEVTLEKYITTHDKIKEAIKDLSEEEKSFKPSPEKWSIREIINHLCDSEIMAATRLFRIVTEDNPLLVAYNQNIWAQTFHYNEIDEELGLLIFGLIRNRIYQILHKLPPEVWIKKGKHSERGDVTFYDMFKLYAEHGESHLKQIQEVIKLIKEKS
ncbi:MAG: hypothetical protein IGBAC_1859 [Ignavibacteriae bacterium]|nr:MAG: hypothetical protein IGBAC_1859 [Ignavibacteriota bacterium]